MLAQRVSQDMGREPQYHNTNTREEDVDVDGGVTIDLEKTIHMERRKLDVEIIDVQDDDDDEEEEIANEDEEDYPSFQQENYQHQNQSYREEQKEENYENCENHQQNLSATQPLPSSNTLGTTSSPLRFRSTLNFPLASTFIPTLLPFSFTNSFDIEARPMQRSMQKKNENSQGSSLCGRLNSILGRYQQNQQQIKRECQNAITNLNHLLHPSNRPTFNHTMNTTFSSVRSSPVYSAARGSFVGTTIFPTKELSEHLYETPQKYHEQKIGSFLTETSNLTSLRKQYLDVASQNFLEYESTSMDRKISSVKAFQEQTQTIKSRRAKAADLWETEKGVWQLLVENKSTFLKQREAERIEAQQREFQRHIMTNVYTHLHPSHEMNLAYMEKIAEQNGSQILQELLPLDLNSDNSKFVRQSHLSPPSTFVRKPYSLTSLDRPKLNMISHNNENGSDYKFMSQNIEKEAANITTATSMTSERNALTIKESTRSTSPSISTSSPSISKLLPQHPEPAVVTSNIQSEVPKPSPMHSRERSSDEEIADEEEDDIQYSEAIADENDFENENEGEFVVHSDFFSKTTSPASKSAPQLIPWEKNTKEVEVSGIFKDNHAVAKEKQIQLELLNQWQIEEEKMNSSFDIMRHKLASERSKKVVSEQREIDDKRIQKQKLLEQRLAKEKAEIENMIAREREEAQRLAVQREERRKAMKQREIELMQETLEAERRVAELREREQSQEEQAINDRRRYLGRMEEERERLMLNKSISLDVERELKLREQENASNELLIRSTAAARRLEETEALQGRLEKDITDLYKYEKVMEERHKNTQSATLMRLERLEHERQAMAERHRQRIQAAAQEREVRNKCSSSSSDVTLTTASIGDLMNEEESTVGQMSDVSNRNIKSQHQTTSIQPKASTSQAQSRQNPTKSSSNEKDDDTFSFSLNSSSYLDDSSLLGTSDIETETDDPASKMPVLPMITQKLSSPPISRRNVGTISRLNTGNQRLPLDNITPSVELKINSSSSDPMDFGFSSTEASVATTPR